LLAASAKSPDIAAERVKVKLGEEFAPDNYRAQAVLSNGNVTGILIQRKGDSIIVRLDN